MSFSSKKKKLFSAVKQFHRRARAPQHKLGTVLSVVSGVRRHKVSVVFVQIPFRQLQHFFIVKSDESRMENARL